MSAQVSKSEFKAKALEYFRQVEATGEPVIVTDHGSATLEVRRYVSTTRSPMERLRNTVNHYDRPLDEVAADDWDVLT